MGFNARSAASETVFIPEDILRSLRYKWKYIVILYDRDKTGMLKARQYLSLIHICKARKKIIMDKLIDSKRGKASEPGKITLKDRLKKQKERRNVTMARHIASITRRCKRMHLNDACLLYTSRCV